MKTISKSILEREYLQNKKSISQLQNELGKDWATIKKYLKIYNISLRTHREQAEISSPGGKLFYEDLFTKKYLIKEYIHDKKGIKEIAKMNRVDVGTVNRYLLKYTLIKRSFHEQKLINYPPKEFIVDEHSMSFIDGLILGDASIPKRKDGVKPRSLTQSCKYEEYLDYIQRRLNRFGITSSPLLTRWIEDDRCKNNGYNQTSLQSHRYKTFEIFRERWYPQGKKIIPKDLLITSDLLLQLYLCDGNFYREIKLCLDAFTREDVLFFKSLLEDKLKITIRLVKMKGNFELDIKESDVSKFLSYIGPCPVNCYSYKWKDNEPEEAKERKRLNARIRYHESRRWKS